MGNNYKERPNAIKIKEFDKLYDQITATLVNNDNSTHLAISVLMACLDAIMTALKKENSSVSLHMHAFFQHAILATAQGWGEQEKPPETAVRDIIFTMLDHAVIAEIISEHFKCSKSDAQQFLTNDTGHFCALGNRNDADHVWMSGMTIFKLLKHLSEKR